MVALSADTMHAGTKRPRVAPSSATNAAKKRKVRRALRHIQQVPKHDVEPAAQDPVFAQGQLLRSIGAALVLAGFDSVKPSALEMFRSHAEEYMLRFLTYVRDSMHDARRTKPTALDFAVSLSKMPNAAAASHLQSQIGLSIPPSVALPSIADPPPPPPAAPDFSKLLTPLMTSKPPSYIPKHFPPLPPRHAWQQTDVFPERETDSRKMRERATEEGTMAEQALRKLAAAAKAGAMKVEEQRRRDVGNRAGGRGGRDSAAAAALRKKVLLEETFADVLKDLGESDEVADLAGNEEGMAAAVDAAIVVKEGVDLGMPEGVIVNHNMAHWRRGKHRQGLHSYV